jgi:hypothetical protein
MNIKELLSKNKQYAIGREKISAQASSNEATSQPQTGMSLAAIAKEANYPRRITHSLSSVRFPFTLMKHQVEGITQGLQHDRFGLFDEARTGKTAIMQGLAIIYARGGKNSIFLMPPALFTQFEEEFHRIENHDLQVFALISTPQKRAKFISGWRNGLERVPAILLMSKEIFVKHFLELAEAGYNTLFFDECHMGCGKETNKVYLAVTNFADAVPESKLILATGTPIPNTLYDLYPLIKLKTPSAYATRKHYDAEHVTFNTILKRTPIGLRRLNVPNHEHYRNLEGLNQKLMVQAVRRTKEEVLDLSAPNIQIVPVKLSSSHLKLYQRIMRERVFEIRGEVINATEQQKLRQVALQLATNPNVATDLGLVKQNSALDTIQAILDSVGAENITKVLLFAHFNKTVEMLGRHFSKYDPAIIYGPNGANKNREQLGKFKKIAGCRLLIANPIAGGVGITAGDVSQTAIFVDPVSTPGAFDQAASRVMLKGQSEPVTIYILKILATISPSLIDLMIGKASTMLDVTRDKQSVFDMLLGRKINY